MIKLMKSVEGKCACGKAHSFESDVYSGKGIISKLPEYIKKFDPHTAYVLCDENTFRAAGERVIEILKGAGIDSRLKMLLGNVHPNEKFIDDATESLPPECDIIISVGSGVINDIGKLVSKSSSLPYVIVATAPSMDGYASMSSSVTAKGLKISLPSRAADVIVGDIDIVKTAPAKMVASGIGDIIAKYTSICEWRISNLITGEYYCEKIASLVRAALKKCVDSAEAAMNGDEEAIASVFDALIVSSVAMNYAGISRPASGSEHYISHMLDMRGEEFGEPTDFHGIQCGIATYICLKLYGEFKKITPDKEKALSHAKAFDYKAREEKLRSYLGKSAESMIALEAKEGKYDSEKHGARLDVILGCYDRIMKIIDEELPEISDMEELFKKLSLEYDYSYLGIDKETTKKAFLFSGDIRDKYVLQRLLWDLGIDEEIAEKVFS
ncbi:MAG: sn-glycerol-1-phosphate dehydrogenase [Clostridia bacterium]|nr:sn-glycerol-1-phosphate dehydrogenase [Clostridia bacterium]